MSGTGPKKKFALVIVQIECSHCGEKMLVEAKMDPSIRNSLVECISCRKTFLAVVPGPIVRGPF
jgi:transcription elongation factor Elf1